MPHRGVTASGSADRDQLTGLPTRRAAEQALRRVVTRNGPPGDASLVKFGIDNFRYLNASHGAATGDLALQYVAGALVFAFPLNEIFRLGGDAFGVLLDGADVESAEIMTSRVLSMVRSNRVGDELPVRLTACAGISIIGQQSTPGSVLLEADLAMAQAKAHGRDRYVVYTARDQAPLAATASLAGLISDALDSNGFLLHCQPVKSLTSDQDQWELLARLPRGGQLLPPSIFFPVADRFGLAERLDSWVLDRAIELVSKHRDSGRRLELQINVSGRSLSTGAFCDRVGDRVGASGIDASSLIFEVSEAALEGNLDEISNSGKRLRDLGCRFALDKFGSQHGCIAQLKHLPIDLVKIDRAFIHNLADSLTDQTIVQSVTGLAHGLGQKVAATFVGDEETLALLRSYGVDFVQGFHVGLPILCTDLLGASLAMQT
ncbi:MAG TPA: bifunctional diguanylate cyclase/phosphodiesterase [Acidimicrobiales bacterium]|nr:bifunctional diguanylate cyclase/phosphodiesterase [Acidimicrobiales bacterium]